MFLFFIFVLSLFIGSFLNVLADRLPRNEPIIKGRSHCEKCKKTLKWFDLIPLLSFLALKGKCRYCSTLLSWHYPAVELITGTLYVLTFLYFVTQSNFQFSIFNFQLLYYLFIVSCLIVVFFADLKYGIIPDRVILPAIVVVIGYLFLNSQLSTLNYFLSAFGAGLFFLLLFLITKGKGMGLGDVKLAFLMGLILGFPNIAVSLYIAFLTGAAIGIILILWRKKRIRGTSIPFGPFLVFGTLCGLFWGEIIFQKVMLLLSR